MKVEHTKAYFGDAAVTYDLPAFVESQLDGDDYGSGSVERAQNTATNNSRLLGRLIEHLISKSLLNAHELKFLLELSPDDQLKITND